MLCARRQGKVFSRMRLIMNVFLRWSTFRIGWEQVVLIGVVLISLAVLFNEINYNLEGDEILSVKLASKQFSEVIADSLRDTPHPPLHNLLLHLWIKAFGASEVSTRSLSIVLSGAFLLLSY